MAVSRTRFIRSSHQRLSELTHQLATCLRERWADPAAARELTQLTAEVCGATTRSLSATDATDEIALAIVLARASWLTVCPALHSRPLNAIFGECLTDPVGTVLRVAIATADHRGESPLFGVPAVDEILAGVTRVVQEEALRGSSNDWLPVDEFLAGHDRGVRSSHGVYFTPRRLADWIVRQTDAYLRDEFQLSEGIVDRAGQLPNPAAASHAANAATSSRPWIQVLDPAAGTGVFLESWISQAWALFAGPTAPGGVTALPDAADRWEAFVANCLVQQLRGREIWLPACVVANLRLADAVARTGYQWTRPCGRFVALGNSLIGAIDEPATIVLGNPPYAALTTSSNPWIDDLLRRRILHERAVGGYYELDGQPLRERKLWLHDDYVKFLRYSQWHVERAGAGIVALVTNHGFLDNLTFRGLRSSLCQSFPLMNLLDLHGGRRKRERAPGGVPDENVFAIDQGVCASLLRKPPRDTVARIERTDLWGRREEKLNRLAPDAPPLTWQRIHPRPPSYAFTPAATITPGESPSSAGWPLPAVMPVYSTAAVTARDRFAIARTRDELLRRWDALRNPELSDEWLRATYFQRTRSSRYPRGDSRSWKLAEARAAARSCPDPSAVVRQCLYRPWDWRWIIWADWAVDWPRHAVMKHLLAPGNVAIVTRRQMVSSEPANYFFVADSIVVDGLIRSDNRGSETFFPLWLANGPGDSLSTAANFASEFLRHLTGLGLGKQAANPAGIAQLIYAQFHLSEYRQRFREQLLHEYPRVFVPRTVSAWEALAQRGRDLMAAHLRRAPTDREQPTTSQASSIQIPARGWPQFNGDRHLEIAPGESISDVAPATWELRIGAHQVCRKFLRDRAGEQLTVDELQQYRCLVTAAAETVRLIGELDHYLTSQGGWTTVFHDT